MSNRIGALCSTAILSHGQHGSQHVILTALPFQALRIGQHFQEIYLGESGAIWPPDLAEHLPSYAIFDAPKRRSNVLWCQFRNASGAYIEADIFWIQSSQ